VDEDRSFLGALGNARPPAARTAGRRTLGGNLDTRARLSEVFEDDHAIPFLFGRRRQGTAGSRSRKNDAKNVAGAAVRDLRAGTRAPDFGSRKGARPNS